MTASSKINSHSLLKRIDGTRGNITVEENVLLVNERNIDRERHTHNIGVEFILCSVTDFRAELTFSTLILPLGEKANENWNFTGIWSQNYSEKPHPFQQEISPP